MVRLTTRVETLREVLEKFLDDDSDMRDMNLAAKEARELQERAQDAMRHGSVQPFDVVLPATDTKTPGTPRSATLTYDSEEEEEEAVEEVEQLLEAYFINLDNTWNKLQTLTEYIDDTEDFINIKLDSQRNQLIRLDLVLTSFTASVSLITAITSLFAMVSCGYSLIWRFEIVSLRKRRILREVKPFAWKEHEALLSIFRCEK